MATLKIKLMLVVIGAILGSAAIGVNAASPWDINGNWAQSSIKSLVDTGVISGYPDGSFKPSRSITRAEFAKVAVKAMGIPLKGTYKFPDVPRLHWANGYIGALADKDIIQGYPDGKFNPKRNVTRAEMATMLTRLVKLGEKAESYTSPAVAHFTDVPKKSWAFYNVEIASKLGILPPYIKDDFVPARPATRAETAYMVRALTSLKVVNGTVAWTDNYARSFSVDGDNGRQEWLEMTGLTTLFRNNITASPDSVLAGDKVYAVSSAAGEPLYIKTYGQVTKNDVLNKASALTGGSLTPYQVQALATGNWDGVKTDLSATLVSRLMENGLNYDEATAIMTKDWKTLEGSAKDRVTQLAAQELKISPDLINTLVSRDFQKAGDFAKVQLAQVALNKLLAM